jgi:hypothetical protein
MAKFKDTEINGNLYISNDLQVNNKSILDLTYPVGSIYMSINDTNPSTLFGGTWDQLKDRFLLGVGDTYTAGSTGGSATVTLSLDQMPAHTHGLTQSYAYGSGGNSATAGYSSSVGASYTTGSAGGGQSHNNMPPYLAVYMWKRVS